jgi:excisionase family DNA binding protein
MADKAPEIMTIREAADYLRISLSSLYKLAQEGRIPSQKVGRHWRFRREGIDRWLEQLRPVPDEKQTFEDRFSKKGETS